MLAADFGNLERDTKMIHNSSSEWIHIDVMDGCFVPNISFGFPVMEAISRHTTKTLDVHLMIVEPERYLERFVEAGADWLTLHIEATDRVEECIDTIHRCGAKAGLSIKPATPVESLRGVISKLDMVLIMSVEPGFGGQKFITDSISRVAELKRLIEQTGSKAIIEVDGGIGSGNAGELFEAGAEVLVAGSSVFRAADPEAEIQQMLRA